MEPLLGTADNQFFEALIAAPTRWEQVANDPNVRPLIDALKAADETFLNEGTFVDSYLSLRQNPGRFKSAAFEVIENFRGTKTLEKLDIFAKAYHLRNTWKLDPVLMHEINKTYGPIDFSDPNKHSPLDWRHPDSHAIYWAVKALKVANQDETRKIDMSETNTDRIVAHSLKNLFNYGKMLIYDEPVQPPEEDGTGTSQPQTLKQIYLRPDLRMFDPYNKAVMAIIDKYKDDSGRRESLENGHRNMLKDAVLSFYLAGHKDKALRIYNQLRKLYPIDQFKVPFETYVKSRFFEEVEKLGIHDATSQIAAILEESYYLYAIRADDEASGRERLAEDIHQYYTKQNPDEIRIDLPEMKWLRYAAIVDFLNDRRYSPYLRGSLLARIKIERPELYKQFDQVEQELRKESGTSE
jgi:hypothetical protein